MYVRTDGTPYYIGKGKPRRPYKNHGRACRTPPKERIIILQENLDEQRAFEIERELISKYGRKDLGTGILYNRTEGGDGVSGRIVSDATKEKMSKAQIGKKPSEEAKKKMSEAKLGKPLSEEHKKNISLAFSGGKHPNLGKKLTIEQREKMSGENHPMYGKKHTKESIEKMSRSRRGKPHSEDHKRKISEANSKPKSWYHPIHGHILSQSCSGLVKMFPEQNLNRGRLSEVSRGKSSHHKQWTLLYGPGFWGNTDFTVQ